jgi:hypothetical protein
MTCLETGFLLACCWAVTASAAPLPPSSPSISPPNPPAWLAGCWATQDAEQGSGEQWMAPAGGAMLGASRTIRGGQVVNYEFMRIAAGADGALAFFAQPSGKPAASFAMLRQDANEVVFENLEHDFPQRVSYRYEPPSTLHASIEGMRNGALKRIAYPMRRGTCPN